MIILLDCDDVLAQFTAGVIDALNAEHGKNYDIKDCTTWDMAACLGIAPAEIYQLAGSEGFCSSLEVVPGAEEGVERLKGIGELYVVTSPIFTSKTWMHERTMWLYKHFGIKGTHVMHVHKKERISGDVLIDDRTTNVDRWAKEQWWWGGIHLSKWWRTDDGEVRSPSVTAHSWTEVVHYVSSAKCTRHGYRI